MASRPFIAARIEERFQRRLGRVMRRFGWREAVFTYTGYGSTEFVRVLCRLVLTPRPARLDNQFLQQLIARRGWRNFVNAPVVEGWVVVTINGHEHRVQTDRNGYVDVRLNEHGLTPGWHDVHVRPEDGDDVAARVFIVDPAQRYGFVSDIDDTVITTSLPRPMLAAWNTFVLQESARQAVPGMSELYRRLAERHPGAPFVYLSTGAWNVAPTLRRFLHHHRYPQGPLLLTDWGPTNTGFFRSGQEHKVQSLRRLASDFPNISWVLVGDDGQHDPTIYTGFSRVYPGRTRFIAIRQLSATEQVLAHGSPLALNEQTIADRHRQPVPVLGGTDGYRLGDRIFTHLGDEGAWLPVPDECPGATPQSPDGAEGAEG